MAPLIISILGIIVNILLVWFQVVVTANAETESRLNKFKVWFGSIFFKILVWGLPILQVVMFIYMPLSKASIFVIVSGAAQLVICFLAVHIAGLAQDVAKFVDLTQKLMKSLCETDRDLANSIAKHVEVTRDIFGKITQSEPPKDEGGPQNPI